MMMMMMMMMMTTSRSKTSKVLSKIFLTSFRIPPATSLYVAQRSLFGWGVKTPPPLSTAWKMQTIWPEQIKKRRDHVSSPKIEE